MIVCPECRFVNGEDVQVCTNCGRSLEPGYHAMVSVRRAQEELPGLDLKTPEAPSKWRPVAVFGVMLLAVGVFVSWRLLRPDPCHGRNFTSSRFGYCLTVPEGWDAGTAQVGTVSLDQFSVPTQSTTVVVEAVDLAAGAQVQQFGQLVRQKDEQAGMTPGVVETTTLGGVPAQAWNTTITSQAGQTFELREVVAVRNEVGWRVTLNDSVDAFKAHAQAFQEMLASWHFS